MEKAKRKELAQQATLSAMDAIKTTRSVGMIQTDEDLSKILCSCIEVVMEETEKIVLDDQKVKNDIVLDA